MIFKLFITLVIISSSAFGNDIPFGPEFNFSNQNLLNSQTSGLHVNSVESEAARDRFLVNVLEKCSPGECIATEYKNRYGVLSYRVTFKDNWFFQIETDPGVIEIQAKPTSLVDNIKIQKRYEKFIFSSAKEIGLVRVNELPGYQDWAGGHIHIGIKEAFNNDVRAFRNFIVDYTNHIELAHRFFSNDIDFAPSIATLTNEQKNNFVSLVKDVDDGRVSSIENFAKRLQKEVYYANPRGHQAEKHQALNVMRIVSDSFSESEKTLEVRGFRAQANSIVYLLQQRALEKRIIYLRNKAPISINFKDRNFILPNERVNLFYKYITESGLPFEDYEIWLTHPDELKYYEKNLKPKNTISCYDFLVKFL
jgi:hypothetical protein